MDDLRGGVLQWSESRTSGVLLLRAVLLPVYSLAHFLRKIGWRVDIYERSSVELIGRGIGIFATHLELLEALDKCGARRGASTGRNTFELMTTSTRRWPPTNAARQPLSEKIIEHGRKLGMQLGVGITTDEDRRFAKLLQNPEGILDWIAVPNFLEARA